MFRANETKACYYSHTDALSDRKLFVHNLGWLLSQTREGIVSAELGDHDIVTITYMDGYTKQVNVNMDSYAGIVRDVMKHGVA